MSGKTRTKGRGKGKGKNNKRGPPISMNRRAGLEMPIRRVRKYMRDGRFAPRLSKAAPIYLTAVLEYCVAEVLELAGNAAKDNKTKTIRPRHVMLAIRTDEALDKLCYNAIFPKSGVVGGVQPELLPKKGKKAKKKKHHQVVVRNYD